MTICLQLDHVNYSYGAAKIRVLSDVNVDFESGKMYAITGPSGAGKSTLLSLLAGLDAPSDGVVRFEGEDIATTGYSKHRREHVSLVFRWARAPYCLDTCPRSCCTIRESRLLNHCRWRLCRQNRRCSSCCSDARSSRSRSPCRALQCWPNPRNPFFPLCVRRY